MTHAEDDTDGGAGELGSRSGSRTDFASSRAGQIKLRLDEDQYRRIQKMAGEQRTTVAGTVRWLVDRGLEGVKLRAFSDIVDDLDHVWARYANRFVALGLEEDIVIALEQKRYEDARSFARAWRKGQVLHAERRAERLG
jgi:hypothetical protein